MAGNRFTREFTRRHFLLDHPDPSCFTQSQWTWPALIYVVYRVVVALYFLVWLVLSGALDDDKFKWFLFLTHWTFLVLTLTTVVMAITSVHGYVVTKKRIKVEEGGSSDPLAMTWFLKTQWVMYNIAVCGSIIVTLGYWTILWKPSNGVGMMNFTVHAFNTIYVMIDIFITAMPVRLLHIWHVALYGITYVTFTIVYCGAGGTDPKGNNFIYSMLDFFGRPEKALIATFGFLLVGVPLVWLFCFGIAMLRGGMSEKCQCERGGNGCSSNVIAVVGPTNSGPSIQGDKAQNVDRDSRVVVVTVEGAQGRNGNLGKIVQGADNTAFTKERIWDWHPVP